MAFDAEEISTLSPINGLTSCGSDAFGYVFSTTVTRRMNFADLQVNCSTLPGYFYNSDFPYMFWMTAGKAK